MRFCILHCVFGSKKSGRMRVFYVAASVYVCKLAQQGRAGNTDKAVVFSTGFQGRKYEF
jgi:hypothetical protein